MQQSCTYGSVRGASGNRRPYRDKTLSACDFLRFGFALMILTFPLNPFIRAYDKF